MISLNPPFLRVGGLTLFADDTDPQQWYYWPDKPQLSVDASGKPSFSLTKYRRDLATLSPGEDVGGGLLNLSVTMNVGQDVLTSAMQAICQQSKLTENPRLAPIVARGGTARLVFIQGASQPSGGGASLNPTNAAVTAPRPTGGGAATATAPLVDQRYVESMSYAATPSLGGANSVSFAVSVNMVGATMMDYAIRAGSGALTGPGALLGVVYDILCDTARPPLNDSVTADWDQITQRLANHFSGPADRPPVVSIDEIDIAIDKIWEDQLIVIAPKGGNGIGAGASPFDSAYVKVWLKRFVTDTFFTPSLAAPRIPAPMMPAAPPLKPSPDAPDLETALMAAQRPLYAPAYAFKGVAADAVKSLNALVNRPGPFEAHFTAQATLSELIAPYPRESWVSEIDLSNPFFQVLKVEVSLASELAPQHIAAVEVSLRYKDEELLCLLNDSNKTGTAQWALDPTVGRKYSYSCTVLFQDTAESFSGSGQTDSSFLVINPRDFYFEQTTLVQGIGISFNRFASVDVEFGYGDQPDAFAQRGTVTLTQALQSGSWTIRLGTTQKRGYQYRLTYYPISGAPVVGPWTSGSDPTVIVNDLRQ